MPVSFCVESISLKDKRNLKKLSLGRNKGEEENQFELNYFLEHTQSNTRARRNGFLKKKTWAFNAAGGSSPRVSTDDDDRHGKTRRKKLRSSSPFFFNFYMLLLLLLYSSPLADFVQLVRTRSLVVCNQTIYLFIFFVCGSSIKFIRTRHSAPVCVFINDWRPAVDHRKIKKKKKRNNRKREGKMNLLLLIVPPTPQK
jgi:hypothetical protein